MVGGLADHLLDLVARPGDGFAGRAAFADHVGDGSGVIAALAEELGGGVDHPGAAVGSSGHGPNFTRDICMMSN